jgi:hypothetical protein
MIGFLARAASSSRANSVAPATLPPGESMSRTIVLIAGLLIADRTIDDRCSNVVPPLISLMRLARGASTP